MLGRIAWFQVIVALILGAWLGKRFDHMHPMVPTT